MPAWAMAAPSFPRGPGFYFNPYKLTILLAMYLGWVSLCKWVDEDARELNMPTGRWNPLVVGGGLAGLWFFWQWNAFALGLFGFMVLVGGPAIWYVYNRNLKVAPARQVLTPLHFQVLAQRYLKLNLKKDADEEEDVGTGAPVRFIARSQGKETEDPTRVARAKESRGYQSAQKLIYEAYKKRATDIHLEPFKEEMAVRYRVDGIMNTMPPLDRNTGDAVVNILKVIANLDITEKRKPQDGSFSAQVEENVIDFRVATAGSVIGEKMVMRVLDRSRQVADLSQIGMRDKMREQIKNIVTQPHGLFLVCGPTGSGKSTTLYSCLCEIDRFQRNVITIENPVEYQLEGVTQIEVNPRAGKTFANELRSILRQDPDVIMIGEIRDQETAEIACQAAQTGHMVFSTVHSNDSVSAISRLIDLGVQPFLIGTALSGVLSQRLVRILCPKCKVRYKPNPESLRKLNLPADKIKYFYKTPSGADETEEGGICTNCHGSGYFKRTGIFELLVITERIKDMIKQNPNITAIKQEAVKNGMRYLYEDGLRQVIEGRTSIQELLRVSK